MINLWDKGTIHIEITNACNLECSNCTRFVGHHQKTFLMDLDMVRQSINSLEGFNGNIGIMGGEPTMHPDFGEICKIVQEMIPNRNKRALWTNGFKWDQYEELILETFPVEKIIYNDHANEDEVHQPLLVAAKDVIDDKELMWDLIDKCWINERWSASITPKGAFFCEVAAAQDHLFDGPGGYPIEKGWWKKTPQQYKDQMQRYCENCSAAIPMPTFENQNFNISARDLVSTSVKVKFDKNRSRRHRRGDTELVDRKFSREEIEEYAKTWMPWSHRPFKQFGREIIVNQR